MPKTFSTPPGTGGAAFTGLTPETLLERSDSKNPATTCKGITKLGRPCRNALKIDPDKAARYNGVLAVASVASDSDDEEIGAAAFFCHKHKDQAEQLVAANADNSNSQRQATHIYPLQNRNSIDTLVARLGVLEVEDEAEGAPGKSRERRSGQKTTGQGRSRRVNRPPTWDHVQGPLMEVPSDLMKQRPTHARPRRKKPSFWASLCCGSADDDYVEAARHKRKTSQRTSVAPHTLESTLPAARVHSNQGTRPHRGSQRPTPAGAGTITQGSQKCPSDKPTRPTNRLSAQQNTETSSLLSYIPRHLPPQTAAQLLAELSKPISPNDDEGYIYIFWLTPESAGPAPSSTASALLTPPPRPDQSRRTSDVLRQYSVRQPQRAKADRQGRSSAAAEKVTEGGATILFKIGRANNVHRRMNEWSRQCGYSLSLVRFYPYVPSPLGNSPQQSPRSSPAQSRRQSGQNMNSTQGPRLSDMNSHQFSGVRKVPCVKRVERLIHLELAEKRALKQCETCGKEHREWFEVEATRDGVRAVDQVVKRWVDWAEKAQKI